MSTVISSKIDQILMQNNSNLNPLDLFDLYTIDPCEILNLYFNSL